MSRCVRRASVGAAVALLLAMAGCSGGTDAVDQGSGATRFVAGSGEVTEYPQAKRVAAPNLTGTTLTGAPFALSTTRGKVVVINFWASWCGPCRAEATGLERVYAATKPSGVEFLGVNVGDTPSRALAYERSFGIGYPSLYDQARRVALQLRAAPPNATPATIVIDRAGRIAAVFRRPLLEDELQPIVTKIAAESS